jgi:hypothetical protein
MAQIERNITIQASADALKSPRIGRPVFRLKRPYMNTMKKTIKSAMKAQTALL